VRITIYALDFPFYASTARGLGRNAPRERGYIQRKEEEKNKVGGVIGRLQLFLVVVWGGGQATQSTTLYMLLCYATHTE
jgi:hypothetical protein